MCGLSKALSPDQLPDHFRVTVRPFFPMTGFFRPELVVIAAGFDAHRRDPASSFNLTEKDFTSMTESVLRITRSFTGGKTLSLLEGGYNNPLPSTQRYRTL